MARVLIVDDDPAIRTLLNELLVDEGYDTLLAADGETAVNLALSEQPQLILMDLMLPVMDGAMATRLIKSNPDTHQIRIIAMSAGANLRVHAEALPADSVLGKPFDLDVILADVALQLQHVPSASDPINQLSL